MLKSITKFPGNPCEFDHNGECIRCDCWASDCGWRRLLNNDFKWENKEDLKKMFKEELRDLKLDELID
jgi:hypothetical protein